MAIPVFDESCCGCCTVRTGSIILGWLSAVGSVLYLITLIAVITGEIPKDNTKDRPIEALVILYIIIYTLFTAASIANLIGIHKEKPQYMVPYMIIWAANIMVNIITFFVTIVVLGFHAQQLFAPLGFAISAYFLLIVRSYYLKLLEGGSGLQV